MSAQALEVSLVGVGMVFRLEQDAWSMAKRLHGKQATHEYRLPFSLFFLRARQRVGKRTVRLSNPLAEIHAFCGLFCSQNQS